MSNRVICQNCGAAVDLPPGYSRAKIRCPGCGYYAEVPPDQRAAAEPNAPSPPPARPLRTDDAESDAFSVLADDPPRPADPRPPVARRASPPAVPAPPAPPKPAVRARPAADPRDHRPVFESDEPAGPPLLEGTQEHDEDAYGDEVKPYTVPGTGTAPCPHCRGQLPLDATLCVHCGRDVTTGAKVKRAYQPIDRSWEEGWPWMLRVQLFVGLQVVNAFAAVILLVTSGGLSALTDCAGLFTLVSANVFQIGLQAFLLGSYDTLDIKRTAKGKASVTRARRLAFYPLPPAKLPWRDSHAIGIAGADVGCFARVLCFYFVLEGVLFALAGVFHSVFSLGLSLIYFAMAAGFYWVVLRPSRFDVNLCDVHGSTNEVAFRSDNREQAEDVATTIAEATGLMYKPAM